MTIGGKLRILLSQALNMLLLIVISGKIRERKNPKNMRDLVPNTNVQCVKTTING